MRTKPDSLPSVRCPSLHAGMYLKCNDIRKWQGPALEPLCQAGTQFVKPTVATVYEWGPTPKILWGAKGFNAV